MTCQLMETTVLKAKSVACIGFDVKIISVVFDMQIHFVFPDYSTAPSWFEPRVTMLFKRMKTTK